jgi:photosystem II stability/assembly factor-like uncharacterized protein
MATMKTAVLVLAALACTAHAGWDIVAKDLLTTLTGVGFQSETKGFIAGSGNGVGPAILVTSDSGTTWNTTQADFGPDVLLLSLAVADNTVIVSSIFGELYSNDDGKTFQRSTGGGLSQNVRYLGTNGDGGQKFGCAGTYFGRQGIALTTDGGRFFRTVAAPNLFTDARYAAFPTDDVWYIAAGQFPSTNNSQSAPASGPRRARKYVHQDANGRIVNQQKTDFSAANTDGYAAQIVKTSDGGKTWETQFAQNGTFYFNGIDCTSTEHCCAVGESSDPPFLGAGIWCTFDGKTWDRSFYAPRTGSSDFSLIDIRWASETVGWAAGGELNSLAPKAWFVKTTDGGKTWDPLSHQIFGYYVFDINVVDENSAYAAVDNLLTQMSGVAKYSP